jgi:hypothetical protein
MLLDRALASTLFLLSGSAAAFHLAPSGGKNGKGGMPFAANKNKNNNLANVLAAGVISAATILPLPGPALAADSFVLGTPLETNLAKFGATSYSVFNSITDVSPLADKFIEFVDKKVKAPDAADVANKAVDGLLAIPDSSIAEYKGILKQVVYSGVSKDNCVTLGGSGEAAKKLAASAAIQSVDPSKIDALTKKFKPANSAVPIKGKDICLPGSVAASEKLWVAQAELTLSMPKKEAGELVASIKKVGSQATRPSLLGLVPAAEGVFSKSPEAIRMVAAGKEVEPSVIATVQAALK